MSPSTPARFASGLLVGLVIAAVLFVVVVGPAVGLLRLLSGAWPTAAAWAWIGGALATQIAATALKRALATRRDHLNPPGPPPGPPPP